MKQLVFVIAIFISSYGYGYMDNDNTKNKNLKSKEIVSQIRETLGLPGAESVIYDETGNVFYVTCQAKEVPGDGSIARVSFNGEILNPHFVCGLNNPKGMAIVDRKLYVGDMSELHEIDLDSGKISKKYSDERIEFLNDVTADTEGNIYVSDMFTSSIYKLDITKSFKLWFSSPELENPNGLLAIDNEIFIASWGSFNDGEPLKAPPGCFQKINIDSKEITKITQGGLGNLDGVQLNGENSFWVSDWLAGKVYKVSKQGVCEEIITAEQGLGDILYLREKNLLVLPFKMQDKIIFCEVK